MSQLIGDTYESVSIFHPGISRRKIQVRLISGRRRFMDKTMRLLSVTSQKIPRKKVEPN